MRARHIVIGAGIVVLLGTLIWLALPKRTASDSSPPPPAASEAIRSPAGAAIAIAAAAERDRDHSRSVARRASPGNSAAGGCSDAASTGERSSGVDVHRSTRASSRC